MKKKEKTKLQLNVETIRRLNPEALSEAIGGLSVAFSACVCNPSNAQCSAQSQGGGSCIQSCM